MAYAGRDGAVHQRSASLRLAPEVLVSPSGGRAGCGVPTRGRASYPVPSTDSPVLPPGPRPRPLCRRVARNCTCFLLLACALAAVVSAYWLYPRDVIISLVQAQVDTTSGGDTPRLTLSAVLRLRSDNYLPLSFHAVTGTLYYDAPTLRGRDGSATQMVSMSASIQSRTEKGGALTLHPRTENLAALQLRVGVAGTGSTSAAAAVQACISAASTGACRLLLVLGGRPSLLFPFLRLPWRTVDIPLEVRSMQAI